MLRVLFSLITLVTISNGVLYCPDRQILDVDRGICYAYQVVYANFTVARDFCRHMGVSYDLVSIHNLFQNNIIQEYSTSGLGITYGDFWLGYNDLANSGNWSWSDRSPATYWRWAPGEPVHDARLCATMQVADGLWRPQLCNQMKQFTCSGPAFDTDSTPVPPTVCPVCQCETTKSLYID